MTKLINGIIIQSKNLRRGAKTIVNSEKFWKAVKNRREQLGLTQRKVAESLEMSFQNYQVKEANKAAKFDVKLAEKVAEILGTTVDDLVKEEVIEDVLFNPIIDQNNANIYDISFLPKAIAEFLSDKKNEKIVIDMVVNYVMNRK